MKNWQCFRLNMKKLGYLNIRTPLGADFRYINDHVPLFKTKFVEIDTAKPTLFNHTAYEMNCLTIN